MIDKNTTIVLHNFWKEKWLYSPIGQFELGRQNGLYLKARVTINCQNNKLTAIIFNKMLKMINESVLTKCKRDAWILNIQSNIPEHTDPVTKFNHVRMNILLNDKLTMNVNSRPITLHQNDAIIFRSDTPHSSESEYGRQIKMISLGVIVGKYA